MKLGEGGATGLANGVVTTGKRLRGTRSPLPKPGKPPNRNQLGRPGGRNLTSSLFLPSSTTFNVVTRRVTRAGNKNQSNHNSYRIH